MTKFDRLKSKAVHLHYNCECSNRPWMILDRDRRIVEIEVNLTCPQCQEGLAKVLIIGGIGIDLMGCLHPGCSCDELTLQVPVSEFVTFLKTPVH
jgi:hypothetical protein